MYCDTRLGGKPRWYLTPPEDWKMRVPDAVRDCVVFIGVQYVDEDGHLAIQWGGTGFFVEVPCETDANRAYVYLVTAQHVVNQVHSRGFVIRANTRDGTSQNIIAPPNVSNWYFHPTDAHADVAVLPLGLPQDVFDYKTLPSTMFLTDEVLRQGTFGIGDEVYITGLFRNMSGTTRNLPIVRIGNVAMMPNERVPTRHFGLMNAYLIEARSLGGLSGSPVFIHSFATENVYLFGLMHGHWELTPTDQAANAAFEGGEDFGDEGGRVNMGIAIVVPAIDILATVNQPELAQMRKKHDEEAQQKNLPMADSAFPDEPEHKTPSKPVSLYPMDEDEALKRLLRVPPPDKGKKP